MMFVSEPRQSLFDDSRAWVQGDSDHAKDQDVVSSPTANVMAGDGQPKDLH